MKLQSERPHYFEYGGEFRIASRRQRFIKAFTSQAGVSSNLRHSLGAGDIA